MARGENKDRQDLSAWETAQDLLHAKKAVYKGKTDTFIAEQEGISKTSLSHYLTLTSMPISLVKLMVSPHQIRLKAGNRLVGLFGEFDKKAQALCLKRLSKSAPFTQGAGLLKEVKKFKEELDKENEAGGKGVAQINKRQGLKLESESGEVLAKVTPNRAKENQFKLDLYGFDDTQVRDLLDAVNEIQGGGGTIT